MKSTHRFKFNSSIEAVEEIIKAENWLSFVPGYSRLESADPNWPNENSSIIVLFGKSKNTVTVIKYTPRQQFITHEEMFGGLCVDDVNLTFQETKGIIELKFIRDVKSKSIFVRFLLLLIYPTRWINMYFVKRRIKAMVET